MICGCNEENMVVLPTVTFKITLCIYLSNLPDVSRIDKYLVLKVQYFIHISNTHLAYSMNMD